MKNYKFRAYDKQEKVMLEKGFGVIGETTLFQVLDQHAAETNYHKKPMLERLQDIELMQFTGKKDTNDNDIYEGDILETFGKMGVKNVKAVKVYWSETSYSFCIETIEKDGAESLKMPLRQPFLKTGDIIGNIYENPELLTN